jgi:hypothetical protein
MKRIVQEIHTEQEAGMKIPKTVELDQSYFRPDGKGVGDQASSMLLGLLA